MLFRLLATVVSVGLHGALFLWAFTVLIETHTPTVLEIVELQEEEEIISERPAPALPTKPFATTEHADNSNAPEVPELLSNRSQTVESQTRAAHGEQFRSADPGLPGDHSRLGMSDLGVSPSRPIGEHGTSPTWEGYSELHSTTDEYLPDIEAGARTLLSGREYAHWMFIHRVKQQVSRPWRNTIEKRVASLLLMGQVLKKQESITKLHVELEQTGEVNDVYVIHSSGSSMLDTAALEVFQTAGPFHNPPKELVGEQGRVAFRWTFVVKQTRGSRIIAEERPVRRVRDL